MTTAKNSPFFSFTPKGDYHLVSKMGEYFRIVVDEDGQHWLQHRFPKDGFKLKPNSVLSFPCNSVCPYDLKRPHVGCGQCRFRAALKGELPEFIRVKPYTIWVWQDRPFAKVKDFFIGILKTFLEMLAAK